MFSSDDNPASMATSTAVRDSLPTAQDRGMIPTRPDYHHGHLRETLTALLERKIQTTCFSNVSLRALCREAGVSQTAFYKHFRSRDELFATLASATLESLRRCIDEETPTPGSSVQNAAVARERVIALAAEKPSLFALCFLYRMDASHGELDVARARIRTCFDHRDQASTNWWTVLGEATELFMTSFQNSK